MLRYPPVIYFVRKVRYLPKFSCELLVFEILKMFSIHATTSGQGCVVSFLLHINLHALFVCLCRVKMMETVDVITRIDFVLL